MDDGRKIWFILTDTSDKENAEALGPTHSAKLHYGNIRKATRLPRLLCRSYGEPS